MPTINVDKKQFESLVGKKLPAEKLKDRISYLGTDLDGIEDGVISVEIFPNRPDMLSVQGFARAFSAFIGVNKGLRNYTVKPSGHKVIIEDSVEKVRPYTACAIVKNLDLDEMKIKSIVEFQEKIHVTYGRNRRRAAIGIYPMEKIEPPIKFIAKKPEEISFVPLDYGVEMDGEDILKNHPKGRDYAHLLEGKKTYPIFIDSKNQVLSMPPIINSETVGKITQETKAVFIECSGFDFRVLRKCLNMIVTSLADMGGEIFSMELVYGNKSHTTPDLSPDKMELPEAYIKKITGADITKEKALELLERMGYGHKKECVLVPAYRADVMHPIDLVEDVAIAYGYENFISEIPDVATVGQESIIESFKRKVANALTGFEMLETSSFHLTSKTDLVDKMNHKTDYIELEKASSSDFNILRTWLIPELMKILEKNKHRTYPQKIFEIGRVFNKDKSTETGIREDEKLAIVSSHAEAGFTEAKQYLQYLEQVLETEFTLEEFDHPSFIAGRAGIIKLDGENIGIVGEINPSVLENFNLEIPVCAIEMDFISCMPER